MLRIFPSRSSRAAKDYYTESLAREDYYTRTAFPSMWAGQGAAKLGLEGEAVTQESFAALADNINPKTAEQLTPRTKDDRIVGYDMNFHVPKGVSILYAMTGDDRIVRAVTDAVNGTMQELESQACTRVRRGGENHDRNTANLLWGSFVHQTARPVDGVPDPHLHVHCYVFNATFDAVEQRWKSAKFKDIKRDARYYEAGFHSRLVANIRELGLDCKQSGKAWDLDGVDRELIDKFSRRTSEIENLAKKKGITDPQAKSELGAKTRKKKETEFSRDEVTNAWRERLTPSDRERIASWQAKLDRGKPKDPLSPAGKARTINHAINHAVAHHFEQSSVASIARFKESALRFALGAFSPEELREHVRSRDDLRIASDGEQTWVTTESVLREERAMLKLAKDGRGTAAPLRGDSPYSRRDGRLNSGQVAAVRHVLESQDAIMVVRGGAGTGKTTLLKEAVREIESRGHPVTLLAPSADASRGELRDLGFERADTVSKFLRSPEMQAACRGGVIWCDEAGLLGTRSMAKLFEIARSQRARVVLMGDTKQHAPIERGDALRLLEDEAGLRPAEVQEVVRQQGSYRAAVEAMAKGKFSEGVRLLDGMRAIKEVANADRHSEMALDFVDTIKQGRSCLVIAPTHAEGQALTGLIRAALKRQNKLGQDDHSTLVHTDHGLSTAERMNAENYEPGLVVRFHQHAGRPGFRAGEAWHVRSVANGRVELQQPGSDKIRELPLEHADRFGVYREEVLGIAKGERVRVTRNAMTLDGKHRLNNGAEFRVAGVTPEGNIALANGWVVPREAGNLAHSYCRTSHSAQGKSVDTVLIAQGSESMPAASAEQFYVSVSRGKSAVRLYTDDRAGLIEAIGGMRERRSATELVEPKPERTQRKHQLAIWRRIRLRVYEHARNKVIKQGVDPAKWARRTHER